ncbi:MAG: hypothetical protein ACKOPG_02815 [Novosphingobium sp.]
MARAKVPTAIIVDANDRELMAIRKISGEDGRLVIRGKIFGAMPMVAKLTPAEARAALKLLDFRTVLFLLTLLFRR